MPDAPVADATAAAADAAVDAVDAAAADVSAGAAAAAEVAADVATAAADVATAAKEAPAIAAGAKALGADVAAQAATVRKDAAVDASGLKAALQAAATDFKKSFAAGMEANAKGAAAAAAAAAPAAPAAAAAAAPAADAADAGKFDLGSLLSFAQSLNLTQVKGLTDKVRESERARARAREAFFFPLGFRPARAAAAAAVAPTTPLILPLTSRPTPNNNNKNKQKQTNKKPQAAALKDAAGDLELGQVDVKNLTSVLSLVGKLPAAAKGLGLDIKLPDVPAMEKIDVAQVVSLFNTAKVLIPKVNLTGGGAPLSGIPGGEAARSVVKALLWKQKVQAASMQLATSVALGILTEGVTGMHNVSMGVAQKALQAVGMKQAAAASGLAGSMGIMKRAKAELDQELVGKLRNSTLLLGDLSLAVQKQAAEGGNFATNMFVQLCNAKIDQLKLALAGKPVTAALNEGLLWAPGTLPKPVYAKAPAPRPSDACAAKCAGEARAPVCTGKRQTWGNACLAACVGARIINPGACPPMVIGTA